MDGQPDQDEPLRKRLRTSHACNSCRARKTRCDGGHPCTTCSTLEQGCNYGSQASSQTKSDLILDSVLRVERALCELSSRVTSSTHLGHAQTHLSPVDLPADTSYCGSSNTDGSVQAANHHTPPAPISDVFHNGNTSSNLENAVLDSMHTSSTQFVLQWPHFDKFPSLRSHDASIFYLEQGRDPLTTRANIMYPYVGIEDIDAILESFEHNVNFWYPTMSQSQLRKVRATLESSVPQEESVDACIALLTMALGCASQTTTGMAGNADLTDDDVRRRRLRRKMGDTYFESALKKLHAAHMNVNSTATQCLFFVALYLAFLVRPLQAWEYLRVTAAKCFLLLANLPDDGQSEDMERVRRVFWSCYIIESDYLAELSACPPSGIARIESSIPLPGTYNTHERSSEEEQSSLYFLACISMRRLLNRVHQLLYAQDAGTALNPTRFPSIVAELSHQLDEWREFLPAYFAFSVETDDAASEAGGFLRQRFLACRSVIYRPYLMSILSSIVVPVHGTRATAPSQSALEKCKICLDACLKHILNLRGFSQTVLVDTWICSLSMSGAMLILLAACRVSALRGIIGPEVLGAGDHLLQLFHNWRQLSASPTSPSVDQSIHIIRETDSFIKEVYYGESVEENR